ncbi:MAG: helix-turn-helix domain-containing protein [Alphaproteobacteria bacterium]
MRHKKSFGDIIKDLREDKGYSQRQFALALDITPTYMSKIERGEFPPPSEDVIKKMAQLLEHNSDDLLAYADKVDSELLAIIQQSPQKYAGLLRKWAKKDEG